MMNNPIKILKKVANQEMFTEIGPCRIFTNDMGVQRSLRRYIKVLLLQIWRLTQDGTNIELFLDTTDGIRDPTWLRSTKEGGQLTVINRNGYEIKNYNIFKVTPLSLFNRCNVRN